MANADAMTIVIVGGGTAGWLTAAFLQNQLPHTLNRPVAITVIEADDIPTVGVGEATIPSIRQTLAACGIEEHLFLKHCGATFKQGIKFINWRDDPGTHGTNHYFHPFGDQIMVAGRDATWQWLQLPPAERGAYAERFSVQAEIARSGRAPKNFTDKPYDGALAYAYHLDAGKLAQFLKTLSKARGVCHKLGKVMAIERDADIITGLQLDDGERVAADLFIDCTGFAARLINSDRQNRFNSLSGTLFVDRAVVTRVENASLADVIGYTKSTAHSAGWIWDIALQDRRGVGHVYSSRHIDDDAARAELAAYVQQPVETLETRRLDMRIGYHDQQWRGNCVAIGLSSGFLEPLESTGIYLIEMANWALLEFVPRYLAGASPQAGYNRILHNHYDNIADFLKLHYCLSNRRDTDFWRDNCRTETIPATLQANLAAWRSAVPSVYDFHSTTQCFSATNYKFVLYGMGWGASGAQAAEANPQISTMMHELAQRRAKLRDFVLRDTVPNAAYFAALQKL
ncbi:tryptophan halogenase family protein [Sandarakinorhabdus sp. AAP62]|uniref:tryptophan halogenase family protein n=1 Tax=Sandarakinorhabdus sp. AAP62 TaxID=1248916 RepID=UPI0003632C1F|nr:tryptophan halogenase family protein [Sandarakinorhabdus sp. AAP62]